MRLYEIHIDTYNKEPKMPKKAVGAITAATDFVLDTFKKVVLFIILMLLVVVAFITGLSALTYHFVK
jgi:hypothetical protein